MRFYVERFGKFPKVDWAITRNVNNILIKEREFWLSLPVLRKPDFEPKLYCSCRVNNKRWTKQYLKDRDKYRSFIKSIAVDTNNSTINDWLKYNLYCLEDGIFDNQKKIENIAYTLNIKKPR